MRFILRLTTAGSITRLTATQIFNQTKATAARLRLKNKDYPQGWPRDAAAMRQILLHMSQEQPPLFITHYSPELKTDVFSLNLRADRRKR